MKKKQRKTVHWRRKIGWSITFHIECRPWQSPPRWAFEDKWSYTESHERNLWGFQLTDFWRHYICMIYHEWYTMNSIDTTNEAVAPNTMGNWCMSQSMVWTIRRSPFKYIKDVEIEIMELLSDNRTAMQTDIPRTEKSVFQHSWSWVKRVGSSISTYLSAFNKIDRFPRD